LSTENRKKATNNNQALITPQGRELHASNDLLDFVKNRKHKHKNGKKLSKARKTLLFQTD